MIDEIAHDVQENVELEREVEQPSVELEQLVEPLNVELYDFSQPVDPLFDIEEPNFTGDINYFDERSHYFNAGIHYFNEGNHHFDKEITYSNHNIDHPDTGEPTIPSTSNNPLTNLNNENGHNSNAERQRHRCHHQCTYQSKQFYEMKRHWKRRHKDIGEIPTSDKILTNLANRKRYQCPFQCPHTYKHLRHLRKHKDDKHKN
ncbi:12815_t:CDS:2 [Gigaspora margarita]|uniref:12815_t:CDS:1 n=1 Tax=Gigaspora margarita TaxID=4874 RepID=A0ABN7V4F9_GIGMA|nr:12815_t:CDS:2 [Gigaspora margarita]